MKFKSIKYQGSKVSLKFLQNVEGAEHAATVNWGLDEPPRPEFRASLNGLRHGVCDILGLDSYAEDMEVTGITFGGDDGATLLVTAKKKLEGINRPLCLTTPLIPTEEPADEESEAKFWPKTFMGLVDTVRMEAEKYYRGDRAQGALPLGD